MFTWKRIIFAVAGLIILLLLFTVTILPGVIKSQAVEYVATETGRTLQVESMTINPLSLSIEVRGLELSDRDQAETFVAWERLRVSLSIASAFRRAPIIDELTLDKPDLRLKRLDDSTFNFSDLIPTADESIKEEAPSEPFRFSVNNVSINKGRIDLIDHSLKEQTHHTIEELHLVLPSIGNLPYMVENPAQPLLSAVINDSPFNIEGQLKPFTAVQEMEFDLKLDNIDMPHYLGYVPVELPVELRNGKVNLDLDILYRISPQSGGELELSGHVDLVSLNIWDRLQEQLFFLPLLQVDISPSQPLKQDIHLSSLRIYNLEVQLKRDRQGTWNHARMATSEEKPTATTDDEDGSPFKLKIDEIDVRDGIVFFEDKLPDGGFKTVAREINIDVSDFALDSTTGMPLTLSLETDREEAVRVNGYFQLNPFTLSLHNDLNNISLGAYEPYYRELYNKPMGGTLSLEAKLFINPEQPLLVSDCNISVSELQGAFNEKEGFNNKQLNVAGLSFDMARNRLDVNSVSSMDVNISFSRNKAGEWSFMSRNFPILAKLAEASDTPKATEQTEKSPAFSFLISDLELANWNLDFNDNQPAEPAQLQIRNLALNMQDMALPEKTKSPLKFSAALPPGGKLEITGSVVLADKSAALDTRLKQIPLKPISPYLAEQTNLVLTNGKLNARLQTNISANDELDLELDGRIGVNRMHLLDGTHKEDLLNWDSLQIAGIEGGLTPLSLAIDSVTLSDYFAKVLIDEEARLNLVDAFTKEASENPSGDEEGVTEEALEPELSEEESTAELPDIRIDKVVLQGGQVDFTDRNLPRPFHADMTALGGRVDGLSSHPGTQATVDLRGSLRNQSPLNITGQLNPLAEDIFLDVELSFRDIEMTPFSPYTGNYVGYLIEKGKLNLSLDYLIEDNQLKATNKVFLDQFDFGSPVESENATSLPVKLAVALLKDGNGEIHLDIPVYGSLDDPEFSIASIVWTVIKNLLVKAATSPFALLGALLGGGGEEDFSAVSFDYGSARISTAEQDKLLRIAKALLDRPSLDVEISGFIDPEKDPEGYRKEHLASKVRRLKYLELVDDDDLPEGVEEIDVVVPAEEYADYLWDVYKEEDFPKPRNFIGMTKKLPESEMKKLIYANTEVDDNDLAELALARALAVQNFFIERGQLPQERIFLKEPDITSAPDEETATRARVQFGVSVK